MLYANFTTKNGKSKNCVQQKSYKKYIANLYPSVFEKDIEYLKNNINKPELANKLTIIIPFLNEQEEVVNTLKSIRDKVGDQVEIIIIDDCSDDGWSYESLTRPFNVSYVKNNIRMGVAASRDLGVCLCRTPYFLLLDAHMRFYDEKWPGRLVSLLDKDDRVVICCQTRFLTKNETNIVVHNTECPNVFGAFSTFSLDNYWPDIEWSLNEQQKGQNIEFIGNIGSHSECIATRTRNTQFVRIEAYAQFPSLVWRICRFNFSIVRYANSYDVLLSATTPNIHLVKPMNNSANAIFAFM